MSFTLLSRALLSGAICSLTGLAALAQDLPPIADADIAVVRQRLLVKIAGSDAPEAERLRRAATLDPAITSLLRQQNRNPKSPLFGAFAEVKSTDVADMNFAVGYFDPVRELLRGYALPGSTHFQSADVAYAVRLALIYNRKHCFPGCPRPGNWWVWAKQMPACLADILALGYEALEPADRDYLVALLDDLLGPGPIMAAGYHHGKPALDALGLFKAGLVTSDRERLARASEGMVRCVLPYLLEPDGTPLMTVLDEQSLGVALPYTYEGYYPVVEWTTLARGTSLDLPHEFTDQIVRYLLGQCRWTTYRDCEMAWHSYADRAVFNFHGQGMRLAGMLADLGIEPQAELRAFATGTLPEPEGCRYWPNAELLVFRTPDLYAALILGSQVRKHFAWVYKNTVSRHGCRWYHGRDGHLVLATHPADASPQLTYTLDPWRLTGTTVDNGSVLRSPDLVHQGRPGDYWRPQYLLCRNPMAGGVTLRDREGAAAIAVKAGAVRARKTFCFLRDPDAIVVIADNIAGRGPTRTVVHTMPAPVTDFTIATHYGIGVADDGESISLPGPGWIHARGNGYVFPEPCQISISLETRPPNYDDASWVEPAERAAGKPCRFLSIAIEHQSDPYPQHTAGIWVSLPGILRSQLADLAAAIMAEMTITRNPTGHLCQWRGFSAAVFFAPGKLGGIQAAGPRIVAWRETGSDIQLAAMDPTWAKAGFSIGLPWPNRSAIPRREREARIAGHRLYCTGNPGWPVEVTIVPVPDETSPRLPFLR